MITSHGEIEEVKFLATNRINYQLAVI